EDEQPGRPTVDRSGPPSSREHHEKAYMTELGHRLRHLREERGMTQHVVAQAAGIATDMVSRLENGHYSSPGLRTLLRIAEGIGLSVSALLPDVPSLNQASPEANLRARLNTLLHRVDIDDLELIVDIAGTIVARRRH
ncbi:MAG: helix-turn-helix transcriptional regulator, partial [Nannocystaceae bacterium]